MESLNDYDYELPEELIAQTPLADRAASRLLHLDRQTGLVAHRAFRDITTLLAPGDLLVLNDTKVSALRLAGHRPTGGAVEVLLLANIFGTTFDALIRPAKRLKPGSTIAFALGLVATVDDYANDGVRRVTFEPRPDLRERLESVGSTPLPPYIHESLSDASRYQTVYAAPIGSAAAPTAGLHFTSELLADLQANGVQVATVTLHVSIDTFRPIQVNDLDAHVMHGEETIVSEAAATKINEATGRVIAVGTTSVRTIESASRGRRDVVPGTQSTKLFIRPGYEWKSVDGMFTNFHLQKTTMMLMISALAGREQVLAAYAAAVAERYRFLSFGDSMLIL